MVNSQQVKELVDALKLDRNVEKIPAAIPVVETNPKLLKNLLINSNTASNATSATVFSTPATQDYYLCAFTLSWCKDATATATLCALNVTVDGAVKITGRISGITLVATEQTLSVTLPHPIKVDRGTNINITNNNNVANVVASATIFGYIDEVE